MTIIQDLAMPLVTKQAEAIAERANSISDALSSNPPKIEVETYIGSPNKRGGMRAVAAVKPKSVISRHQDYIGYKAAQLSKDAARL